MKQANLVSVSDVNFAQENKWVEQANKNDTRGCWECWIPSRKEFKC